MGKVKLAVSNKTGEKMAIKIIPRYTSTAAAHHQASQAAERRTSERRREPGSRRGSTQADANGDGEGPPAAPAEPSQSFLARAHAKDVSKEVRTIREAAIVLLLHHPYICGMRSMLVYPHHYYMVFEYVNGGQMLDYIIAHGRLRERSARKFARQIGSALEYAHGNSIVHRDLKIENILISKTGNIKIIDFGLSNLWSPHSNLATFCGSLYFAAPELLNAKAYTGPEVDVWSFGIVLYVLVCGKVPFDDQSMPALHAKIKRGQVEYPAWLSSECKHILSRMLVTNPAHRSTLNEVLAHPWMTKGFDGPPSSHLPHREPLRPGTLDPEVIKGMTGFEFGAADDIECKLADVLSSTAYGLALRAYDLRRGVGFANPAEHAALTKAAPMPAPQQPLSPNPTGGTSERLSRSPSKRFSGFDFYRRKIAGGVAAALSGNGGKGSSDDPSGPASPDSAEFGLLTNGVRPDSLDPTRGFHPLLSIYYLVREKIERERIYGPGVFASSTLSLNGPPLPPAPQAAYQAQTATAVPTALSVSAPQPTTRAPASAFALQPLPAAGAAAASTARGAVPRTRAAGDDLGGEDDWPGRSSFSATRRSPGQLRSVASAPNTPNMQTGFRPVSTLLVDAPGPAPPPTAVDKRRSMHLPGGPGPAPKDIPGPARLSMDVEEDDRPLSVPSGAFARRFGSILGRSASGSDGDYKRQRQRNSVSGATFRPSNTSPLPQVTELRKPASGSPGADVARANTVSNDGSPRRGHARGHSQTIGARDARSVSASLASATAAASGVPPVDERVEDQTGDDTDDAAVAGRDNLFGPRNEPEPDQIKPVYLKGLFSVATTSTKPVQQIRDDFVRVLDRLGVQHRSVRSGFECVHAPSIDLASVGSPRTDTFSLPPPPSGASGGAIKRRASRLGITRSPRSRDRDLAGDAGASDVSVGGQTATTDAAGAARARMTTSSTSFTGGLASPRATSRPPLSHQQQTPTSSSDLVIRFEINIVKVPWLPGIHGLQFRRTAGNAFTYSMLARTVLKDLKL